MIRPTICVTLSGCSVEEMLADAARATAVGADLCEVRLDKLWVVEKKPDPVMSENEGSGKRSRRPTFIPSEFLPQSFESVDLINALSAFKGGIDLPVVMTCRPTRQGGFFPGSEEQRILVLQAAIESGVSWVDLEVDIDKKTRAGLISLTNGKTKIISSAHIDREPESANDIVQEIEEMKGSGEIIKLCYATSGRNSALKLFEAAWNLRESDINTAIMGIGSGGDWNRIHAPLLSQNLVYSTMESGSHLSSQGRINASDLLIAWDMLEYC